MPWISKNGALTQSEMENNADIAISYLASQGVEENTIAAILGNMQAESTINPGRYEGGVGPGYGLVQWTPRSSLIEHAQNLGYSNYQDGDVQLKTILSEVLNTPSSNAEWYTTSAFISPYYNSGATSDMVGITGQQFLSNSMGWDCNKLAIMFMAGYERPSYDPDVNHYQRRMEFAGNWLSYMGGRPPIPGGGKPIPGWSASTFIQWGAIAESSRLLRLRRTQGGRKNAIN